MVRRLMSRRGGSASQPQVTPYQQLELDDGWREWENTKQELVLVKRQLGEKDALILQLKTGTRRLQETLRKKDKDLHAAFAILRSPQEAKTTKTRKQELIDRLVSECMQRAVTAEALAEERRRELDRLRYSSKFLRFQELEVEIEECHTEIERLRAKIETTIVPSPIVAGKLRVSSVPLPPANGAAGLAKKIKLDPLSFPEDEGSDNQPSASAPTIVSATRMYSAHSAAGQVRVVPLAKFEQREGFVSKTRRRALEAEYYKQVRLAQLEVECELEENLHIRAAREAKRIHSIELQDTQTELVRDTVRSQLAALEVSSTPTNVHGVECTNEVRLSYGPEDTSDNEGKPKQGQTPTIQVVETEASAIEQAVAVEPQHTGDANTEMEKVGTPPQIFKLEEKPQDEHPADMEMEVFHEKDADDFSDNEQKHLKQKAYEVDDFDASDEGAHGAGGAEHTVWNTDPNPHGSYQLDDHCASINRLATVSSNDDSDNRASNTAWNEDPIPAFSDSTPTKTEYSEENDVGSVVWNLDPCLISPQDSTALHGGSVVDKDDDDVDEEIPHAPVQLEHSTHDTNQVWNLDLNPSDSVKLGNASDDESFSQEVHANDTEENQVWNLDPAPSRSAPRESDGGGELFSTDIKNGVELVSEVAANSLEEGSTVSNVTGDQSPPDSTETAKNENASDYPEPPPSSSSAPLRDKLHCSDSTNRSELLDPNAGVRDVAGDDKNTTKTWNLDPVDSSRHGSVDGTSPGNNGGDERSAWNLDPQSGDASEPNNIIKMDDPLCEEGGGDDNGKTQNDVDSSLDENEPTSSRSEASMPDPPSLNPIEAKLETGEPESVPPDAPDFYEGSALGGDMIEELEPAEHTSEDASQQNSPRESEEDNPMDDDATPEYTPPSSARDESGDDNDDDTTW